MLLTIFNVRSSSKAAMGSSTPETEIETFKDREAWWVKIVTPGRWKRILGPYSTEQISLSKESELRRTPDSSQ